MPIVVTCECGKVTRVPDAYAGRTGKCPACKRPVKVPLLEPIAVGRPAASQPDHQTQTAQQYAPAYEPEPAPVVEAEPEPQHEGEHRAAPEQESHYQADYEVSSDSEVESAIASPEAHEPAMEESPAALETSDYDIAEPAPAADPEEEPYAVVGEERAASTAIAPPPSDAIPVPTTLPEKLQQPNCPPLFLVITTAGTEVKPDFDAGPALVTFVETFAGRMKKKFDVRLDGPAPEETAPVVFVRILRVKPGNRFLRFFLGWLAIPFKASTCFEIEGHVQDSTGQRPFKMNRRRNVSFILGGDSLGLLQCNAKSAAKDVAAIAKNAK